MDSSSSKLNILKKLRNAQASHKIKIPFENLEQDYPFQTNINTSLEETFAQEFIALGGKFVFCQNEIELFESLQELNDSMGWKDLYCSFPELFNKAKINKLDFIKEINLENEHADACITDCEFLVARTGSVLLSSRQNKGRTSSIFYPAHIIVAYTHQLVADLPEGVNSLTLKYKDNLPSMINLNTGPSRTADIEKTLVVGVHGPKEVYCFLIDKQSNF